MPASLGESISVSTELPSNQYLDDSARSAVKNPNAQSFNGRATLTFLTILNGCQGLSVEKDE